MIVNNNFPNKKAPFFFCSVPNSVSGKIISDITLAKWHLKLNCVQDRGISLNFSMQKKKKKKWKMPLNFAEVLQRTNAACELCISAVKTTIGVTNYVYPYEMTCSLEAKMYNSVANITDQLGKTKMANPPYCSKLWRSKMNKLVLRPVGTESWHW